MSQQQLPHKIVLKSTTKISLNERFTHIQATTKVQNTAPVQQVRAQMAATQQASAKNRRLAQQMGNRPAVQAALRLKKKSLKQRLGSDVRSRLNLPRGNLQGGRPMRGRGRGLMRGGSFSGSQVSLVSIGSNASRGSMRGGSQQRGRGGFQSFQSRGRGFVRGSRRAMPATYSRGFRGGAMRGAGARGRGNVRASPQGGPNFGQRGRGRGRRPSGDPIRGRGGRGARRGQRGGRQLRGQGRGGRGANNADSSVTREQLDDQLDQYMCKTKGHLDNELDDYMQGGDF